MKIAYTHRARNQNAGYSGEFSERVAEMRVISLHRPSKHEMIFFNLQTRPIRDFLNTEKNTK
jgi:hypothetical protein